MPADNRKYKRGGKAVDNIESASLETGKVPPQARDLEVAVLGAMMLEQSALEDCVDLLQPNCFFDPRTRMVYEAVAKLYHENKPVDMLSVSEKMKEQGTLEKAGGASFLAELVSSVGSAAHVEYHTKILIQKAIQRNVIDASFGILREAFDESTNVDNLINTSLSRIYDAVSVNMKNEYKPLGNVLGRSMEQINDIQSKGVSPGIRSGFPKLDGLTSGWKPSNLIIIGARPSVGKTAFALNLARAAAESGVPVGFFTLEMHDTELTDRLLSSYSGIPANHIHGNNGYKLTDDEWQRLEKSLGALGRLQMYIDETPSLPITEFATKAKRMVHDHNVGLIIIDYLQLMTGTPETQSFREQEVASISRRLKATAKELNIPIIALAQLNRNSANRVGSNGRPVLSDLRESGSIEQDADMVLFVHRPAVLGLDQNYEESYTEISVSKNRSGKTGLIELKYVGDQFRFEEPNILMDYASQVAAPAPTREPGQKSYNPFDLGEPSPGWM